MKTVNSIDRTKELRRGFALLITALLLLVIMGGGVAHAQDPSQVDHYDQPYGIGYGDESRPYNASTRDENGNRTIVNGRFVYSGSHSSTSGVGGYALHGEWGVNLSSSAIGNSLNVVTTGNNNTVIVDSTQINNGDQEATIVLNGEINFD